MIVCRRVQFFPKKCWKLKLYRINQLIMCRNSAAWKCWLDLFEHYFTPLNSNTAGFVWFASLWKKILCCVRVCSLNYEFWEHSRYFNNKCSNFAMFLLWRFFVKSRVKLGNQYVDEYITSSKYRVRSIISDFKGHTNLKLNYFKLFLSFFKMKLTYFNLFDLF